MLTLTFLPSGRYQCPGLGLARDLMLEDQLRQTGCQDCPVFASCKMSHWTTMDTQLTDVTALGAACAELNLKFTVGGRARGYAGTHRPSDFVIHCPGEYDISVLNKDGNLSLTTDWYRGTVEAAVGKDYGKLLQLYGVHKATAAAKAKRYRVVRKTDPITHAIHLTIHV